jgi:hypothetical protein
MSGRKLTVDWKHTAEELYAHDSNTPNTQIARRFQALFLRLGFRRKAPRPMAARADAALQTQGKQGGFARR